MAVYFLKQTFSKNKCLNYQLVKSTVSEHCVVCLEQLCDLKRFYVYPSIMTLGFSDPREAKILPVSELSTR